MTAPARRDGDAPEQSQAATVQLPASPTGPTGPTGAGRRAASGTGPGPGGERGSLTIADEVVEKVAVAAAAEVDHVGGANRRLMGVSAFREDGGGAPRVSARVAGQVTSLEVRLSVRYPASVRGVTEAVRGHLHERVHTLTGLTVSRVDISVAALAAEATGSRRVVA